ncbi:MAG: DUF3301 domain-containing protein, partial [Gammaproteobacteria bacterium]|nr:DUF3301 domain-containing protein [Gammaproteobacteria bacterium]
MEIQILIFLALIIAGAYFTFDSLRARELANRSARHYCAAHGLQFLDGTAALTSISVKRFRGKPILR